MAGIAWTEDEIFYLKGNYGKISNTVLSKKLGRSINSVQRKAQYLNLTTPAPVKKTWTYEEEQLLIRQYKKKSFEQIAKKLKRSTLSVKQKATKMNLYVDEQEYLSLRGLGECFHSDARVVYRWMEHGLPYRSIQRGKKNVYEFDSHKFWCWAETHKELIPFDKYENHTLNPEPKWLQKELISISTPKRHCKPISKSDISYVITQRNRGKSFSSIANDLQRTKASVQHIYFINKNRV